MDYQKIIADQAARIESLEQLLQVALARIEELEAQLQQNSRTSHRPPSSDGVRKSPAFPRKKGGKRGGKPGHQGNTLKLVAHPDEQVIHPIGNRCSCGANLATQPSELSEERRQVFDLPPAALQVVEHRVERKTCTCCGQVHTAAFPEQVAASVQYGPGVRALVGLLNVEHGLPVKRISQLFGDLYGHVLNEATVQDAVARLYEDLAPEEAHIHQQLSMASVAHFDESGVRVQGQNHWLHVVADAVYTYYFVHAKRGEQALRSEASVLPYFTGRAIHDCWASYFKFEVAHGLCGAHLLRELREQKENYHRQWAAKMYDLLLYLYTLAQRQGGCVPAKALRTCQLRYEAILRSAYEEEPPPSYRARCRAKKSKGRNLADRLNRHREAVLAFASDAEVPFTNNLAERAVRPWKTKLKVSGCFRTLNGAALHARIKGFCDTARKQGQNLFEQLQFVQQGYSFLRPKTA